MRAYERLIKYTKFETASLEGSDSYPSTPSQLDFGKALVAELKSIGADNASIDSYGYVTAQIPSNVKEKCPTVAFIAHMDTVRDVEYKNVKTHLVPYNGGDICLSDAPGALVKASDYPFISSYIGKTLLVTDGTTLLGADDKAGVAEIMCAVERFINDKSLPHGIIKIAFTPDEEIGCGVDHFDIPSFGADYAYTLDGAAFGEIEYETFNAAAATIEINGVNIHPGSAKGKMKNAVQIACELAQLLPEKERPETTELYEGFYHPTEISGTVEHCIIKYILRDHDKSILESRKQTINSICEQLNKKYGSGTINAVITDSYSNMKEYLAPHMHIIKLAENAISQCGAEPVSNPVRGGTDGCRLSQLGLPCPNLGTGSHNHHGKHEFAVIEDMDKCVDVIIKIAEMFSKQPAK